MKANLRDINHAFESFKDGKERGFEFYFHTYYKALCFFANRYMQNQAVAEDIASEGFIQLWNNREQIKDEKHLRNWLYKTAYHGCLRWVEREKTKMKSEKAIQLISANEEKDCTENIIRAETLRQLKIAMDQLPTECRKVFHKLYIEGKTVAETANELHLTISTIKNQKARGIKLLRLKLNLVFLMVVLYFFY